MRWNGHMSLGREEINEHLCQAIAIFLNGIKFETVDNKLNLNLIFSYDRICSKIFRKNALLRR
jgi:hypothetical protein